MLTLEDNLNLGLAIKRNLNESTEKRINHYGLDQSMENAAKALFELAEKQARAQLAAFNPEAAVLK